MAPQRRVLRTAEANQDLLEIWVYLAENSLETADRFLEELGEKSQALAEFPGMGRARPELAPGLRSFPVGRYVLFYLPAAEGIEVVRVLHGARDIQPPFFSRA